MFERIIEAITPFGLTFIVIAGAVLTGWVKISNPYVVGLGVVAFGILLIVAHIVGHIKPSKGNK